MFETRARRGKLEIICFPWTLYSSNQTNELIFYQSQRGEVGPTFPHILVSVIFRRDIFILLVATSKYIVWPSELVDSKTATDRFVGY